MLIPIPDDPKTRDQVLRVILIREMQAATDDADLRRRLRDALFPVRDWVALLTNHGNGD